MGATESTQTSESAGSWPATALDGERAGGELAPHVPTEAEAGAELQIPAGAELGVHDEVSEWLEEGLEADAFFQTGIETQPGYGALEDVRAGDIESDEALLEWLAASGAAEWTDENAWTWIGNIVSGAAQGAATGAMAGPWGALAGGLVGAGLGAVQTAQQQGQPSPRPAPAPPTSPPASGPRPAPPRSAPPGPRAPVPARAPAPRPVPPSSPAAPAQPGGSGPAISSLNRILQDLVQLLPQVTRALSVAGGPRAAEVESDDDVSGDVLPDRAFPAETEELGAENLSVDEIEDAERGIDWAEPEGVGFGVVLDARWEAAEEQVLPPEYASASRFVPAAPTNYRRWTEATPRPVRRIVVHITDGAESINGTIAWFQDRSSRVSAHYIVGQDGEVVQMVRHNDVAWHAGGANGDSIGVEHVARAPRARGPQDGGLYPTAAQYCSSAALVRWLCEQYRLPLDRVHIVGHAQADPRTTHRGCPDAVWDWGYYMSAVATGACIPPPTASVPPAEGETAGGAGDAGVGGDPPAAGERAAAEWAADAFSSVGQGLDVLALVGSAETVG